MSKREIRAKRLVAAVLLTISVQMWSAPPLWAAEASVQTETSAAGEAKETKDAKAADSETGGEADADEGENVVVPVIGYSTRSAAGSDYGVMPLADMAVDGALTGVTGINDAKFYADTHDLLLGYNAKSQGTGTVALGSDANAGGQYSTAIGASASATAENSSALGMYARAGFKDSVAIGFSSNATADNMVSFGVTENGGSTWTTRRSLEGIANIDMEGTIDLGGTWTKNASGNYESNGKGELTGITKINDTVVYIGDNGDGYIVNIGGTIGYNAMATISFGQSAYVDGMNNIAIGSDASAAGSQSTAVGGGAYTFKDFSTAIGGRAYTDGENSTALGANSTVAAGHTNSVAIGSESVTSAANQVSFGHKAGDIYGDGDSAPYDTDLFRSLTNISNIEMHGGLTGVTGINNVTFILDEENSRVGIGNVDLPEDAYNGIAIGANTTVTASYGIAIGGASSALGENSIAIGSDAFAKAANGISLGEYAKVGEEHTGSVAIGSRSTTTAANQVSFGQWSSTKNEWTNRRSLAGISDIEMQGNISLGGTWTKNATSGEYESNGKGELTGVTKINGVVFQYIEDNPGLAIGGYMSGDYYYSLAIGGGAGVAADNATAVGFSTSADGENSTAIGNASTVYEKSGTAIGASAYVQKGHTGSVAIGYDSATTAADQVAFGTGTVTTVDGAEVVTWTNRRSLAGISDIDMAGNISLGGEWKENATAGIYESNGKGELNGVTSINGVIFAKDSMNNQDGLLIGTLAPDTYYSGSWSVMIGTNIDNQAIDAVGIGNDIKLTGDGSVAIGNSAEAISSGGYPTAIGFMAHAVGIDAVAIGANSNAEHEYSVALGDDSSTSAEKQVSFGNNDLFRSLVNVADIEMHGALTGVTGIDGVTVSGTDASTGLTVGGNAVIGKTNTPFSSTGFAVDKEGAVTAKTVNGATITGTGFNGVTLSADGKVNGAAITSNSFNGVTLEKGADSHYKVGGVDVTKMQTDVAGKADAATVTALDTRVGKSETDIGTLKTTVGDSSKGLVKDTADLKAAVGDSSKGLVKQVSDVDTAYKAADTVLQGRAKTLEDKTAGISRSGSTTTLETNTSVSSSGITTNKATVSGATATTLENGKLTVGAATVQNTGFAVGSSSLNNGSLTVDGNNKLTTAGLTANKVTVGAVTVSGGKVSGLTDAALSAVSTEAVTGKQLNATNTTVSALDTAYKAADTQIRTDFAAADTTLQNNIDAKVAQTAYDTKMSALDSADTALGSRSAALETKTAKFNTAGDNLTGMANITSTAATLGGVGFASAGVMTGVSSIDGIAIDASRNLSKAGTYNGVTVAVAGISGTSVFNGAAITNNSFNGVTLEKGADNHYKVGGVDVSALKTTVDSISADGVGTADTAGIKRDTTGTATTTIETNTAISSSGITTNAVTASGTVKAGEFVEGDKKLSDKYAAKTALADYTTTTDMNTKLADYATTTAVDTKLADYAKSDSVYSKAAADTAFAKAGDVDTLKTTVGDADGGLVKDVTELQSGKADKATTLAGYGIADAYTQTEINEKIVEATKDLATSATVTDIQSGLDEVTGKTAGLSYDTASGSSKFSGSVVIGNEGAKTHTQITDDAIIFGEGTDKQVTVDASGIHVGKKAAGGIALYADADGTHIDHTSLVTGSVTADNLNGVAISGNATDGLSVGGVSIKALSERLDSLEQDGVATADMGGIKRTDVVENSGKTIIEDTTSFTKDGLKTAKLEAATAALGGVNFAAGAVTGVSSINGVVFGSDGKIGGVSLSGGKVDGVDVGWLDQRVKSLEDNGTGGGGTGGGGSSANTSGIHKPDRDTTNIEGNTSITTDGIDTNKVNASDAIVVADGEKNKTVISKDGILVAEGEKNQVKINEDGIHVGKNSSVVNDTDGFITDKGLYIGVSSSSDTSTAKFSVAPNGNLSSKAGDYGFSNTSADGAKFTHSGDTAYGTGSQLDTTIQGNKVTTGRIDTDELYVDGNKVTVAGGTIGQTDAVDNHLSGTDADGNTVTNDFKTSAVNGTTQAAEKTSADGKESTKTVNNTSAGGTGVTTSKTTTDSKDNVTVKESSFGTNEKGMTLSTSNKVTDKDGKVTKDTSGTTTMTGDSISVSKTTTTTEKDADGNEKEVTKTSGTTIGSGEVTLKREDGSTIEVGSAIEGMQSDMRELDGRVNRMGVEIKEVGALSAALAGLHPQPENANSRADFAMAMGSYEGKQALAVGGFYRPDKRTMLSIGASTTSSKHMMNMGISIALDRLPEAERKAKEAAKAAGVEQETLNRVLERLAALEQDNRRLQADNEKRDVAYEKLAADYTQLKEKYIEETADRQQPEQAEAEE